MGCRSCETVQLSAGDLVALFIVRDVNAGDLLSLGVPDLVETFALGLGDQLVNLGGQLVGALLQQHDVGGVLLINGEVETGLGNLGVGGDDGLAVALSNSQNVEVAVLQLQDAPWSRLCGRTSEPR